MRFLLKFLMGTAEILETGVELSEKITAAKAG